MFSENNCGGLNEALRLSEERIRQLEDTVRRLKVETARQRRKQWEKRTRAADKQRQREISQIRRKAVNVRWSKARANAEPEAPAAAESYKAANAVSAQSQNIVHGSARKTLRKTYRPTHAQVTAFMRYRLKVRESVAEEEAQSFLDYYDALNWEIRGTAITDWEACARSWIKKAERYRGKGIYEEPQALEENPVTGTETQRREEKGDNGLVVTIFERMRAGDYSGTTGATTRKVTDILRTGIYPNDWIGELARKVYEYSKTAAASTHETFYTVADAESYTVDNAESTQVQIIVPCTAQDTARNTYRPTPTEAQVCEYMQSGLYLPKHVAEEEARKFFDFYSANGWTMKGAPIADWKACVRNWVNRAVTYMDKQQRQQYEGLKNYLGAIRSIEEDAEYKRIHGEEELPF